MGLKPLLDRAFVVSLILYVTLHFAGLALPERGLLSPLISLAGLVMLACTACLLPVKALFAPLLLITIAAGIVAFQSFSPLLLWRGLNEMADVLPIVAVVPLVGWIIDYRPYVPALMGLGRNRLQDSFSFFVIVSLVTHVISVFIILAGIIMVYHLLKDQQSEHLSREAWDFTLNSAIIRGYNPIVLWSIFHPSVAYSVAGTGASLYKTVLAGVGLAALALACSAACFAYERWRLNIPRLFLQPAQVASLAGANGNLALILEFGAVCGLTILGTFAFYHFFSLGILLIVPCVVMLVTLIYFAWQRDLGQVARRGRQYLRRDLPTKKKEVANILAAGVLVATLKGSGFGSVLFALFLQAVDYLRLDLPVGLTLLIFLLGFCGLSPVPSIVLLSGIIGTLPPGYTPEIVALSLLLGVAVTSVTAPVTIPLLVLSSQNNRPLIVNGFFSNYRYSILLFILGQAYLRLLRVF